MKLRIFGPVLLLVLGFGGKLNAQEVLMGDGNPPALHLPKGASLPNPSKTATAAPFPFFDDFSYDSLCPSALHWELVGTHSRVPGVSVQKAIGAPTKGVATFDGTDFQGKIYQNTFGADWADSLVSNTFDLSTLSPADSLYLSFFLEPGGRGESPEPADSIALFFDSTGNRDWKLAFSLPAGSLPRNQFGLYLVPVREPAYFHGNFRFMFRSFGSLNGEQDQWHLDAVYFAANRSIGDTLLNDRSPISLLQSPLFPFTAFPYQQFNGVSRMGTFQVEVSNPGGSPANPNGSARIFDPSGTQTFSGTTSLSASVSIPALSVDTLEFNPFSDQTLVGPVAIRLETSLVSGDSRPGNDTLRFDFRVDSLMAYDDGVSDNGYGMTMPRSFCQEFRVSSRDTLTAIWIHFTPSLYYNSTTNQSTPLENYGFKLIVWNKLHPDSVLYMQSSGTNVTYADTAGTYTLNYFHRYPLGVTQRIDSVFWVGIEQVDNKPIGVGFDTNQDQPGAIYYETASNQFQRSTQKGTLMIRPEFGRIIPSVGRPEGLALAPLKAYPQPIRQGNDLFLEPPAGGWPLGTTATLVDLQGKYLWQGPLEGNAPLLPFSSELRAGLHLLQVYPGGQGPALSQKILVLP